MLNVSTTREHAIVIGGGIAGLLAARVLLHSFEKVTLIERDHYPPDPVFRAGTPQGRHVHFMPLKGQQTLEALFPGLGAKLLERGAIERTYGSEGEGASIYYYAGRCPQVSPVLHGWNCSRPLLEWQIRQELCACPKLHMIEEHEVVHLLSQDARSICGVRFRARTHSSTNPTQELFGSLVIDASGSSSHLATWLSELGFVTPRETILRTWVNYATRVYRPIGETPLKEIAIQTRGKHSGVLMEVENGNWMVVLSSIGQEELPPTEEEHFLAFANDLPENALYEAITNATPISPIYGYRKKTNFKRRILHQPEGFLIIGDALCSFNPIYGQGMTVAALEAALLDKCLQKYPGKKFARKFQSRAARLVAFPWLLAAAADADGWSLTKLYIDNLTRLLPHDSSVLLQFLSVLHMIRPPVILYSPKIIAKVFRQFLNARA